MALILIRHASAGSREDWRGDDRVRPLDEKGERQARALVELLADLAIERILTSPYRRCVQTVVPLSVARGLDVELREELGEELQMSAGAALVRSLSRADVAVCGHGGLELALADPPKWRKGAVFVVGEGLAVAQTRRP